MVASGDDRTQPGNAETARTASSRPPASSEWTRVRFLGPDLDEMACIPPGWDQDYVQIGRGRTRGFLSGVSTPRGQVGILHWRPGVLVRSAAPRAFVSFVLPLGDPRGARLQGRRLEAGVLEVLQPGQPFDLISASPLSLSVVTMTRAAVLARAEVLEHPLATRAAPSRLRIRGAALAELRRATSRMLRPGNEDGAAPRAAHEAHREDLLDILLDATDVDSREGTAVVRTLKARRALDFLHDHAGNPDTTLGDVCRAVQTSVRTLHLAFQESFGIAPKTLLKQLRLDTARRRLRSGSCATVTDAALTSGYSHLGRFAADYARQFGECPSTTLRKMAATRRAQPDDSAAARHVLAVSG